MRDGPRHGMSAVPDASVQPRVAELIRAVAMRRHALPAGQFVGPDRDRRERARTGGGRWHGRLRTA
ncbi:MAG TPA: hypothetical protein VE442_13480 [Jatrophihabitans sp.]|jgi:hypothetical protein|nr:hypothetical protein [Jatrophihabitans sp.]